MKKQKIIRYINTTYGKLTIKKIIPFYRNRNQLDYKCDVLCGYCNTIGRVYLKGILNKKTKSCGCMKYKNIPTGLNNKKCINLIGKKFDRLTVIDIDENKKYNRVWWKCRCDCGNNISVLSKNLIGGRTKSCGCIRREVGKKHFAWKGYNEISGKYWWRVKKGSIDRNLDFSITIEDAWNQYIKQNKTCALTGENIEFSRDSKSCGTASLDRIDSNKGYTKENIQWVHKDINLMKMDISEEKFINWCKKVIEYRT